MGLPRVQIEGIVGPSGQPRAFGACSSNWAKTLEHQLLAADRADGFQAGGTRAAVFRAFDAARAAFFERRDDGSHAMVAPWVKTDAAPQVISAAAWAAVTPATLTANDIKSMCANVHRSVPRAISERSRALLREAFKIATMLKQGRTVLANTRGMVAFNSEEMRGRGSFYLSPYLLARDPETNEVSYVRVDQYQALKIALPSSAQIQQAWVYIDDVAERTCPTAPVQVALHFWDPRTGGMKTATKWIGANRTVFRRVYDPLCLSGKHQCNTGPAMGPSGRQAYYGTCASGAQYPEDLLNMLRAAAGTTSLPDDQWRDEEAQHGTTYSLTMKTKEGDDVTVPYFEVGEDRIRVFMLSDYERGLYQGNPDFAEGLNPDELYELVA